MQEETSSITAVTRILLEPEVRRLTGVSRITRWRWEREGQFPKRLQLGTNVVGWREDEVLAWARARVALRDEYHDTSASPARQALATTTSGGNPT